MDFLFYRIMGGNFQPSLQAMWHWLGTRVPSVFVGANKKHGCYAMPHLWDIAFLLFALFAELGAFVYISFDGGFLRHQAYFIVFLIAVLFDLGCGFWLSLSRPTIQKLKCRQDLLDRTDPQWVVNEQNINVARRWHFVPIILLIISAIAKVGTFPVLLGRVFSLVLWLATVGYLGIGAIHILCTCYAINFIRAWKRTRHEYRAPHPALTVYPPQPVGRFNPNQIRVDQVAMHTQVAGHWTVAQGPLGADGLAAFTLGGTGIMRDNEASLIYLLATDVIAMEALFRTVRAIQLIQSTN